MRFWDRTTMKKANLETEDGKSAIEDRNWENLLFHERLPDEFTDQVMLALEGIEIEPADRADASDHDVSRNSPSEQPAETEAQILTGSTEHRNRRQNAAAYDDTSIVAQLEHYRVARRSSQLKVWSLVVAVAVFVVSTLLYTQPTLADMVRSLFAKDSYVDSGMKKVREAGLVQISSASAKDQGYTLKVNELIADSTRMIIGIDVFDAKGNAVAGDFGLQDVDFSLFDNQRGDVGAVPFGVSTGGNETTSRIEFDFMRPVLTDKLQLSANIRELRLYADKLNVEAPIKTVKGDWRLNVEADLTKAKAQTLLTPIDKTYETPSGLRIHMQGATRTPSGGSLEYTTELTPEAAGRALNGQSGFHELKYHLEDAHGKWLGDNRDPEFGRRSGLDRWSGKTHWFYQFNDFAYDKQQIRFVLDGYIIRERSEASVVLDPAQTSAVHPVKFEDSGDAYLFKGLKLRPNSSNSGKMYATIPVGGMFSSPNFTQDIWVAVDENGKEYSMFFGGSYTTDRSGVIELQGDAGYFVDGLNQMPKQLTLKRKVVNHLYKDADWSFVIPQTGTNGVILK
ncbi:DUF4179 domain-containing protein [Paenibacillus polymyxa]|uniref:DUF4179 domain-containing protein n=1 Tax=Paenibacillus polymyxa TaxID=1406 RepID=UPI002AB5D0A8|nr:DUF4179 domain-containing protein [Paenibacillus polymyxa]MDY7994058.1 DUF4179 domain-containing protein [Paenibacillus polymyxa]MDY8120777.1 DUF4179 domain-containing protein [Paenibacillus polymyxa]